MNKSRHSESRNLLLALIENENAALDRGKLGDFYGMRYYDIKPLIPRAARLLDDEEQIELYLHLLRNDFLPAVKSEAEFDNLRHAYQAMTPLFDFGVDACRLRRSAGFLVFGNDGKMQLADEPAPTLDSYSLHRKVWGQVNAYVSIPAMIDKRERFLPYAADAALRMRILKLLVAHAYMPDNCMRGVSLWYWGLVFIVVLDQSTASMVVGDVERLFDRSQEWTDLLRILRRYLLGAGHLSLVERVDALLVTANLERPGRFEDPEYSPGYGLPARQAD